VRLVLILIFATTSPQWTMSGAFADEATASEATASHHCEDPESSTRSTQDHGQACSCCFHGVCGCWSGCGVVTALAVIDLPVPVERRAAVSDHVDLRAPPPAEPLRPPIA
jgi:hypothetical protein